ncbi:hypothetical protein CLOM_g17123 [Closterium sp. NIES-68]|nr:hypothetical protein CLOM_g17123 [Closterium sp. NIES-68]GJP76577.1 hypothetical protein CLOP_g7000 [Closterium sp. NIES-67]
MKLFRRCWVSWLPLFILLPTCFQCAQSQLLDPSQAAVLEECQTEWQVRFNEWTNGGDCGKADAIQCDDQGMITKMSPQGYVLQGSLPASIGNLVSLTYLDFYGARLNGTIPDTIGQLTALTHLMLWFNYLDGTIPYTISALTNLKELWLGMNQLSGTIPDEISSLTALTWLDLGNNHFSGPIPHSLGLLSNLRELNMGSNRLTGSIPPSLGHLSALESLNLIHNQFSGSLPATLGQLSSLTRLWFDRDRVQCAARGPCEVTQLPTSRYCAACSGFCAACSNDSGVATYSSPTSATKVALANLSPPAYLLPCVLLLLLLF